MGCLKLEDLKQIVNRLRTEGKKIVLTNGCFDILHIGHVRYLEEAKKLGDVLIVGINSDSSAEELKGEGHPILSEEERAEIVSSLSCVDYTVIFNELNPEHLIREIKPDIHAKGGDYSASELPEAKLVESLGGEEVILEEVKGKSTSNIIQKISSTLSGPYHYGKDNAQRSPAVKMTRAEMKEKAIGELEESANLKKQAAQSLPDKIVDAALMIIEAYRSGRKLLLIGNGGSADDAQHIAAEFVGRFKLERESLPAIALTNPSTLTAIANDYGYEAVFSRQIQAFAEEGDILVAISTSGSSANILKAIDAAVLKGAKCIGLTGKGGEKLEQSVDLAIMVPSDDTPRIQEAHITIGHIICGLVEEGLFR